MGRWFRLAFLLLGGVILLGFLLATDFRALARAAGGADRRALTLALALVAANVAVKAVRWQIMTEQLSRRRLAFPAASAAILSGVAAGSLTPARGMELAKPLLLRTSHGVPMASSAAAVLVERLLDGGALVVMFGSALVVLPAARGAEFHPLALAVGILLVGAALLLVIPERLGRIFNAIVSSLPLPHRIRRYAAEAVETFAQGLAYWRQSGRLTRLLLLSVAASLLEAIRLTVVFGALGASLSFPDAMLTFSAGNLLAILTLIPGGVGITELSMAEIAARVAVQPAPRAVVAAAVLTDRVLSYYLPVLLGGLLLLFAARRVPRAADGS